MQVSRNNGTPAVAPLLACDFDSVADVVTTIGTTFYVVTDDQAERKRLVAIDLGQPDRRRWREVVAEADDILLAAHWLAWTAA